MASLFSLGFNSCWVILEKVKISPEKVSNGWISNFLLEICS